MTKRQAFLREFPQLARELAAHPERAAGIAGKLMAIPEVGEAEWPQLWEAMLACCGDRRKKGGSFYTPRALIHATLKRAFSLLEFTPGADTFTILDPAAGAGLFLSEAIPFFEAWKARRKVAPKLVLSAADRDAGALAIAKKRMELAAPAGTKIITVQADSLLEADKLPQADLVVGNPPFVAEKMLPAEMRGALREKYAFATGRFNLFTLFMEAASRFWLRPDAMAALVVPDRLLRNVQLAKFRAFLTGEMRLLALDEPPAAVRNIPGAAVDCVVALWQNRKPQAPYTYYGNRRRLAVAGFPENLFSRADFICKWRFPVRKLGELVTIRDGIIQSKVGRELFVDKPVSSECRKLLRGSDVGLDEIRWADRWVDYRPAEMTALERGRGGSGLRLRTPEIFTAPKILSRQTGDVITAALDGKGEYFYANTLHGMTAKSPGIDLEYLMLYLNSASLNRIYQARTGEAGRAFAQVKIALLRELPVPVPPLSEQRRRVSEFRRITQAGTDKAVALGVIFDDLNG